VLSESYVFRNCARSVKTRQSSRGGENIPWWRMGVFYRTGDASKYILRKFNVVFIRENAIELEDSSHTPLYFHLTFSCLLRR
jgi:hypothetical protein